MKAIFLKRNNYVSNIAIETINALKEQYKLKKISINEIEVYVEGTNTLVKKEQKDIDSFIIFKAVLGIGKLIEDLIDTSDITSNKDFKDDNEYYEYFLKTTLINNIDILTENTIKFISDYGFFVRREQKAFNLLDFVLFCYRVFEVHYLYKSIINKLLYFNYFF